VAVETPRRQGLRQHHTGTHLLHAALRRVLGTPRGPGRLAGGADHLRFDFSHGGSVKDREVEQIEELVNERVQANTPVTHQEMDIKEALASGAMALFGEKYGDRVRVVRIGDFSTSCAAARISTAPARSASSRSIPRAPSPPGCGGSRPWPARPRWRRWRARSACCARSATS
jgi:alanyl-tRNA synthetase